MSIMRDDYHANSPTIPVAKVRRYARELNRLEAEYGRGLRAKEIVREAHPRKSPLHDYFEWNKTIAAAKYRLEQARQLVAIIRVTVVDNDGREVPTRALVSVITREKGRRIHIFEKHDRVLDDPDFRTQRVDTALNELEAWCRRWEVHRELGALRRAIMRLVARERRRILAPARRRNEARHRFRMAGARM